MKISRNLFSMDTPKKTQKSGPENRGGGVQKQPEKQLFGYLQRGGGGNAPCKTPYIRVKKDDVLYVNI